jgi:phospholipid/cholesterol/gamma-HCH transport system substrate-binding protein
MKLSKEFKVGLFMVSALVLLYFGFNYLKGVDFFSRNKKYYAVYTNVDKLTLSNLIYLNGLDVGRVSDIEIMQSNGNMVLVELEISSSIQLSDSTVAILTGDFLGNKSILLKIGKGSRHLQPGDTLLSMLDRGIADILAESAVPVADNLQITMRNFNTLVDNLVKNTKQLDTIFSRLQTTPVLLNRTLGTANATVEDLSTNFKQVATNLNEALEELKPALVNFHELSDSLKAIKLNEAVEKMKVTLESLNKTIGQLEKNDNTMGKLLTEDELYNNLNRMFLNMDTLANHFNSYPKHFLAPLGKSQKKIERDIRKAQEQK